METLENGNATFKTVRMTSGNSEASYAINSERQGLVFRNLISKPFENLLRSFARKNNPDVLRVTDLGCATGQNAKICLQGARRGVPGVPGMLLCCMGRPDSYPPHKQVDPKGEYCGPEFDAAWNDLVREGLVTQDTFDGFNLPMYFPNAQEVREAVESTGRFEVEMGKVEEWVRCMEEEEDFLKWVGDYEEFGRRKATFVKSFVGSLVEESLGAELADFLFQRMGKRCSEFLEKGLVSPSPFATITIVSLVKK